MYILSKGNKSIERYNTVCIYSLEQLRINHVSEFHNGEQLPKEEFQFWEGPDK
jgi:hypothetical protein